jgi:hypothetical protein
MAEIEQIDGAVRKDKNIFSLKKFHFLASTSYI